MNDITFYVILGALLIFGLALVLRRPKDEDPLASRRRYSALIIDIVAIALVSLFRFGALGLLFGGC